MQIRAAVDIYQSCDMCFRGMAEDDRFFTGQMREVVGDPDHMTPVAVCGRCMKILDAASD